MADLGRHQALEGQIVLGAAVLDDILGIILLAVLYEASLGSDANFTNVSKIFILTLHFF